MNLYTSLKSRHEKMINAFPMAFAFSEKQFAEAKEKLGVTKDEELYSIPAGGMIRKVDGESYGKMLNTINSESEKAMRDDEYLYQGFLYELGNHEYGYTYEPEDTLSVFGLTQEEVNADQRLERLFSKAVDRYLSGFNG